MSTDLYELSLSLKRLRALLEASKLPQKELQKIKAKAADLGDECYFHIGWLCALPDEERSARVGKAKQAEIDQLLKALGKPKSRAGRRPRQRVPMNDKKIAQMYLEQPLPPEKSVEKLINEAIYFRGFDGNTTTDVHARRIRRLIKRMRADELATE